jgi:hypothetical protein
MNPEPQGSKSIRKPMTAIGAGERFPVVLVEGSGALGALFAQHRCPGEILEDVLYFRALMEEPYALCLRSVELVTIDGFSVAQATFEKGIFYEPSLVPYAMRNISSEQYRGFVDRIVDRDVKWVEESLTRLFADAPGFGLDAKGKLVAPENYACGLDHFLDSHAFIEPKEAKRGPDWR